MWKPSSLLVYMELFLYSGQSVLWRVVSHSSWGDNPKLMRYLSSLSDQRGWDNHTSFYLKGLWRWGLWEPNKRNIGIPHVFLHLVTNFQPCRTCPWGLMDLSKTPFATISKVYLEGFQPDVWCHKSGFIMSLMSHYGILVNSVKN